jgi:hypothetical protein
MVLLRMRGCAGMKANSCFLEGCCYYLTSQQWRMFARFIFTSGGNFSGVCGLEFKRAQ